MLCSVALYPAALKPATLDTMVADAPAEERKREIASGGGAPLAQKGAPLSQKGVPLAQKGKAPGGTPADSCGKQLPSHGDIKQKNEIESHGDIKQKNEIEGIMGATTVGEKTKNLNQAIAHEPSLVSADWMDWDARGGGCSSKGFGRGDEEDGRDKKGERGERKKNEGSV